MLKSVLLLLILNVLFLISKAQTTHLVTNTAADNSAGSLRAAVAAAASGDTIRFSAASFTGGGVQTVALAGLGNYIGFNQDNLVFKGFYNAAGDTVKVSGSNICGIFVCNASANLTVDSMIIINASSGLGSAIDTKTQNLTVNNSIFNNNTCIYSGGAINANRITVNNSIFNNNTAPSGGGGAIVAYPKAIVTNSIFNNNSSSGYGGAIVCDSVITSNCTFANNTAPTAGALDATSYANVTNSVFSGNTATSTDGGAISCTGKVVIVTNSTFSGNTAVNRGGGVFIFAGCSGCGNINITNSTFGGNTAYNGGGAYACSDITAVNSTFKNNTALLAAGISAALINAVNSTITGNTATFTIMNGGGGIGGGNIEATSSIIALNTGGDIVNGGGTSTLIASGGYNIFTDRPNGTAYTDQVGINSSQLNLGTLQNNGGNTFTILPGTNSIAIGKGNPTDKTNDQRGFAIASGTTRDVGAVTVSGLEACMWNGSINTAWENSSNWSCGHTPTATTIVSIYSPSPYYPIINSPAICNGLNLMPGSSCTVNTGGINIIGK
jgi:predicted outer membrane repeat protein